MNNYIFILIITILYCILFYYLIYSLYIVNNEFSLKNTNRKHNKSDYVISKVNITNNNLSSLFVNILKNNKNVTIDVFFAKKYNISIINLRSNNLTIFNENNNLTENNNLRENNINEEEKSRKLITDNLESSMNSSERSEDKKLFSETSVKENTYICDYSNNKIYCKKIDISDYRLYNHYIFEE
jgi:hypothetical protein